MIFLVFLPESSKGMKNYKQLSIFVVEDNLMFQQLIAKQLESISHTISFFTTGESCINELSQTRPDVIILDNNLDGNLTGLDTLKTLRQLDQDMYVVLFSTEQALDSRENVARYGKFEYVEKNEAGFRHLKDKVCTSRVYQSKSSLAES